MRRRRRRATGSHRSSRDATRRDLKEANDAQNTCPVVCFSSRNEMVAHGHAREAILVRRARRCGRHGVRRHRNLLKEFEISTAVQLQTLFAIK